MDGSMPGSYVLHYLLDFLRFMSIESVMLSNHLIFCCLFSPFAFNLSHYQGLFQWVDPFYQIAKVLELQQQRQFFRLIVRVDFLYDWFLWSPCSPRESQESSPTPQFKSIDSSACSLLYGPMLTSVGNTIALTIWTFVCKVTSLLFNMLYVCHSFTSR